MTDPPTRIYLQSRGDAHPEEPGTPDDADVTWCRDRVFEGDVEYVRADSPTTLNPAELDDDLFVFAAFRYALGRTSYIPDSVANVLVRLAPHMTANARECIVKEIDEAEARDGLGHDIDLAAWVRVREAMTQESTNDR